MNNRSSWSSGKGGHIQLGDKPPSGFDTPGRHIPVRKAALEDGIIHLLATAAEMQQRQDLESANQLYEAAIAKMKAHGLDRKKFLTGTAKKPAPLNSRTPVEWSVHVGDMRSVVTLLGDPNAALAEMASTLTPEQLEGILDAGASVEHRIGPYGRTFLLRQASEGNHRGVQMALDRGASISCMDDNGDTALALALRTPGTGGTGAPNVIKDLLDAGADINLNDGYGCSMLRLAVERADPEVLAKIIDLLSPLTAKHNEQLQNFVTNLIGSRQKLSNRSCGVLRLLLKNGLDPNISSKIADKQPLFAYALRQDQNFSEALVTDLIELGAKLDLQATLRDGQLHVVELVLTRLTPLGEESHKDMIEWVQRILASGKWPERDGKVLKILLDFGLNPDLRSDMPPHSPLIFWAVDTGDLGLVKKLIASKASLTAVNDDSVTVLIRAARLQNRAIYDAIKAGGANDKYFLGWTVWSIYNSG